MSGRPADDLDGFGLDEQWRRRAIADSNGGVDARTPEPSPDGWHSGVGAWAAVDDDSWEGQPSPDGWHSGVGAWAAVDDDSWGVQPGPDWWEDDGEEPGVVGPDPDDVDVDVAVWDDEHRGARPGHGARHRHGSRRRRAKGSIRRRRL